VREQDIVTIKRLTSELGDLLKEIKPTNPGEWWAFERITGAHKSLRSIDYAKIGQTPLDIDRPATKLGTCPECKGTGQIAEENQTGDVVQTPCPTCQGSGKAQIPLPV